MLQLWDRQLGETPKAFKAFVLYRDAKDERTYEKVAEELQKSGTLIRRWASKYNWIERGRAFDVYEDRKNYEAGIRERRRMQDRHANMAVMAQQKFLERLTGLTPDEVNKMPISVACRLFDVSTNVERRARGNPDEDQVAEIRVIVNTNSKAASPAPMPPLPMPEPSTDSVH